MHVKLKGREVRLATRPTGAPSRENFEVVESDVREPGEGEIVVRNTYMSVDPYMRGRMNDVKSYVPPFKIDEALEGGAVGVVVASRTPAVPEGSYVLHQYGWREYAVFGAKQAQQIDAKAASPTAYLGVLGMPGFTAWVGLHEIGGLKSSDVVFISSAAGAVGSVAGQLAKLRGATVIGSAGSDEKVAELTSELGFDAAFNYKGGEVGRKLRECAPSGIDLYFDNVGGEQLQAALNSLNVYGRIAVCGMISQYNEAQPGPTNLPAIIGKRLTMRGFIVFDHLAKFGEFAREAGAALASGKLKAKETIVEGLENAPQAFIDMLRGGVHNGKVLVRIAKDSA